MAHQATVLVLTPDRTLQGTIRTWLTGPRSQVIVTDDSGFAEGVLGRFEVHVALLHAQLASDALIRAVLSASDCGLIGMVGIDDPVGFDAWERGFDVLLAEPFTSGDFFDAVERLQSAERSPEYATTIRRTLSDLLATVDSAR